MLVHVGFLEIRVAIFLIPGYDIIPHGIGKDVRTGLEQIAGLITLHEIFIGHPRFDRDAVQTNGVENQKTEQKQRQQTEERDESFRPVRGSDPVIQFRLLSDKKKNSSVFCLRGI